MSLINKMLQDLDARGTPAAGSMQVHIKPVGRDERGLSMQLVALAAAGALALALIGGFGWRYLHTAKGTPPAQATVVAMAPPPAQAAPAPTVADTSFPRRREPMLTSSRDGSLPDTSAHQSPEQAPAAKDELVAPEADQHKKARKEKREEQRLAAGRDAKAAADTKARVAQARKAAREQSLPKDDAAARKKQKRAFALPKDEADAAPTSAVRAPAGGRQESPGQRAEGAYRRGLASLQEGRVGEAIAALEQALQVEPKHDAARQTLVGLLIENKRGDEAMRQLQLGLALDPRQPALAMLLARLQIERGASGIDTLTRSLPYAAGNGDYQALLAGALQRQQRHHEAAEQYQAALRTQPQNGVWWMGLGISLQAEKRNAEALDAFQKARAAGTLSPELQGFVDRKLFQLSR